MIYSINHILGKVSVDSSGIVIQSSAEHPAPEALVRKYLRSLRSRKKDFITFNKSLTKKQLRHTVDSEEIIVYSSRLLDRIRKSEELIGSQLRELISLVKPVAAKSASLLELIKLSQDAKPEEFGAILGKDDSSVIWHCGKALSDLQDSEQTVLDKVERAVEIIAPNCCVVAGPEITAKLISASGSLEKLSRMPSSGIQLLGASKALFRHLSTKAKCPKYGFLHDHLLVKKTKMHMKGKVARELANSIAIAVRVDFFKGQSIGKELRKKLDEKWN